MNELPGVIGHREAVAGLPGTLPPVTLVTGPDSVGKWTFAEALVRHVIRPYAVDIVRVKKLTADAARGLVDLLRRRPTGPSRVAIVNLDAGTATTFNILLKTLEEPPPRTYVILTSSRPPAPTIISRINLRVGLGLLSETDLATVLVTKRGTQLEHARELARIAHGSVERAMSLSVSTDQRNLVLTALKAAADGDELLLEKATDAWGRDHHLLLRAWCMEAMTGMWTIFDAMDGSRMHPHARRILDRLDRGARPRLAVLDALLLLTAENR